MPWGLRLLTAYCVAYPGLWLFARLLEVIGAAGKQTALDLDAVPFAILFGAAAYAFIKRRTWARPVVMLTLFLAIATLFMAAAALGQRGRELWQEAASSLLWFGALGIYLYAKPSVVRYYESLAVQATEEAL